MVAADARGQEGAVGVQRIADLLVADGLGAYQANPHHQRAKLLQLTQAGRAALHTIDATQRQWCDALGDAIGETTLQRTAVMETEAAASRFTPCG